MAGNWINNKHFSILLLYKRSLALDQIDFNINFPNFQTNRSKLVSWP